MTLWFKGLVLAHLALLCNVFCWYYNVCRKWSAVSHYESKPKHFPYLREASATCSL